MSRSAAASGVLICALLSSACGTAPSSTSSAGVSPSGPIGSVSVNLTRLVGVEIADRAAAAIEIAFDAASAAELVAPLPANADFAAQAVLCLFIGQRDTGGWSVAVQSIRIVEGRLEITARETEPRGGAGTGPATYPADCVQIDRSVLPVGTLPMTSTDMTSDEFIVDGVIDVPAPSGAP